jgi:hypothetical protein
MFSCVQQDFQDGDFKIEFSNFLMIRGRRNSEDIWDTA